MRNKAKLLKRQPKLGSPTLCMKKTETYKIFDICVSQLYRYVIFKNQTTTRQWVNGECRIRQHEMLVLLFLNGDDLNS